VPGRRLLVIGIGGGADIVSAYDVTHLLHGQERTILYGNTKKRDDGWLMPLSPHVHRLRAGDEPSPQRRRSAHGTTSIDRAIPRGPEGCPFIVTLPDEADAHVVAGELVALGIDGILGIDTGGDALATAASSGDGGRDKRMLRVLDRTGLPTRLVVIAPGSDGETPTTALHHALQREQAEGRYHGCFPLEPVLDILREQSATLEATRTPRIILDAVDGPPDEYVVVPRGLRPAVPRRWLTHGFVFALPDA
jgi:hypothetical protein